MPTSVCVEKSGIGLLASKKQQLQDRCTLLIADGIKIGTTMKNLVILPLFNILCWNVNDEQRNDKKVTLCIVTVSFVTKQLDVN